MLFPTAKFVVFFSFVFLLYWYAFRSEKERKIFLTVVSYVFYCSWNIKFAFLLFFISIINFLFGLLLGNQKNYMPRKLTVFWATTFNILYLCFFKYTYTILSSFQVFFPNIFLYGQISDRLLDTTILIPIGISYYTFKCMSYIFDVYLCKMSHRKSLLDILVYIAFFPQILSGPIVSASTFFKNFEETLTQDKFDTLQIIQFDKASLYIMSGLFKKMIIATFLTLLVTDKIFATPSVYHTLDLIFGLLSYSIVIYCDFSGYSDMAIGIALLLGFTTEKNFNRPYIATSVTEFWRRWHISFSSWLREYVFFAIGGSRFGIFRNILALLGTMLIAGLWHGARFTFLLWGLMQGIALAIEKLMQYYSEKKLATPEGKKTTKHHKKLYKIIVTFTFINLSWLVFRSETINDLILFLRSIGNFKTNLKLITPTTVIILIIGFIMQLPTQQYRTTAFKYYIAIPTIIKIIFLGSCFLLMMIISTSGIPPFIYFNF